MKFELKNFLINICGWIFLISVCFFLIVLAIFIKDEVQQPIKETLTLTLSFLSAIATIGAAIIAARIFQTWKTQHSYIEQTKCLVQMEKTITALQAAFLDVRKNDNLKSIFLGQISKLPMDIAFTEQIKRAELLGNFVSELTSLENQIYLINTVKGAGHVFFANEQDKPCMPFLGKLNKLISRIQNAIESTYEAFSINYGNGFFVITNLDLSKPSTQEMILLSLFEGDELLRKVAPDSFEKNFNPINDEIVECLLELNQSILKYKDTLDTLN